MLRTLSKDLREREFGDRGCDLVPPYSLDFKPSEQAFSKLNAYPNKAAERAIP
ncbi:hypothetical protein TPR58_12910 [Sphingomonas sp. HF-S3]|uniref:Uncharacterized protein n=1 Tax=Sphingomonas rustica TaxID=3103142 RepID=A0ABV0B927_9SPHN